MASNTMRRFAMAGAAVACTGCSPKPPDTLWSKDAMLTREEAMKDLGGLGSLGSLSGQPSKKVCESVLQTARQFEAGFNGAMRFADNGTELSATLEAWMRIPQRYRDNLLAIVALVGKCNGKPPRPDQQVVVRDQMTGEVIYSGKPVLGLAL